MTHAKEKPLVPITREFLRQFYQKYPLAPVPVEARLAHLAKIAELSDIVTRPGSKVQEQVGMPTPTRIDDCFWRNRMICEELALSVMQLQDSMACQPELAAACAQCHSSLVSAERSILAVQEHNTASVKAQLQQFIPQDFRGALLERQRVATEARYKKQIDDLVKRGGSVRQKYDLYLQQQWERRQALVQLGECSGVYKVVIKWLAGIPQVLLDFAKEINAKLGPMEEQRIKYGPDLYGITELGIRLNVCLAAWVEGVAGASAGAGGTAAAEAARASQARLLDVVEPAVQFYCDQMLRVIRHIGDVFQHSPFFVNKEDLAGQCSEVGGDGCDGRKQEQQQQQGQAQALKQPRAPTATAIVDADCGSSNLSAGSASGDFDGGAAPLSFAPSVTAPSTPAAMLEGPPRAPTGLSVFTPSASGRDGGGSEALPTDDTVPPQQLPYRFDARTDDSPSAASSPAPEAAGAAAGAAAITTTTWTPTSASGVAAECFGTEGLCRVAPAVSDAAVAGARSPPASALPTATPVSVRSIQGHSREFHVGLRGQLSTESHASFLSALERLSWLNTDECGTEQQQHQQHQQHQHQQQQLSPLEVLSPQPQPQHSQEQLQLQPRVPMLAQQTAPVCSGCEVQVAETAVIGCRTAAAAPAAAAAAAPAAAAAALAAAAAAPAAAAAAPAAAAGPMADRPTSKPGLFTSCFGRSRRPAFPSGSRQQQQQQQQQRGQEVDSSSPSKEQRAAGATMLQQWQ